MTSFQGIAILNRIELALIILKTWLHDMIHRTEVKVLPVYGNPLVSRIHRSIYVMRQ